VDLFKHTELLAIPRASEPEPADLDSKHTAVRSKLRVPSRVRSKIKTPRSTRSPKGEGSAHQVVAGRGAVVVRGRRTRELEKLLTRCNGAGAAQRVDSLEPCLRVGIVVVAQGRAAAAVLPQPCWRGLRHGDGAGGEAAAQGSVVAQLGRRVLVGTGTSPAV
jgi:hypothetical protein